MTAINNKLLPCPFCGAAAEIITLTGEDDPGMQPEPERTCCDGCNGCDECTDYDDSYDEPECQRCHGDGMDPWNDYLLPCPLCCQDLEVNEKNQKLLRQKEVDMGVVVVTDVFCDKCGNWGTHSSGLSPDKKGAIKAVREAGWEIIKTADRKRELHCPQCLGKVNHFWQSWYTGQRGITVGRD